MFFITALFYLFPYCYYYNPNSNPNHNHNHIHNSNIPAHASSNKELPITKLPQQELSGFDTNNNGSYAILLRVYYSIVLNNTADDLPFEFYNETAVDLSVIQRFFHYYDTLQILQSPYVSQQNKLQIIQLDKHIFPTSSFPPIIPPIIPPNIHNHLDW